MIVMGLSRLKYYITNLVKRLVSTDTFIMES